MARRKIKINSRLAVAVLGEGITEREYFKSLKKHKKLRFRFKPEIPKHSDIKSIISKANDLMNIYDIVFCIIDLDRIYAHPKEKQIYYELKSKNKHLQFIEQNPCFEIWFLLHYEFSGREYFSCEHLIKQLKKYISNYQKSGDYLEKKDLYKFLKSNLQIAIDNSLQLERSGVKSKCEMYKVIQAFDRL
jgi:hypothetical protein